MTLFPMCFRLHNCSLQSCAQLNEVSGKRPLYYVTLKILYDLDLFRQFQIPFDIFNNFMSAVEDGYKWFSNTYHNDLHAADVTHSTFLLLMGGLIEFLSPLEQFSLIMAAVVHDLGHPGVNNDFLIKIGSEMAFLYNDQSVNENNHLNNVFELLRQADKNILVNISNEDTLRFRSFVIEMILTTDMARHHAIMETCTKCIEDLGSDIDCWPNQARLVMMQLTLHCADIGNQSKPYKQSIQWTNRVMEEFFSQGDLERKLQLPVSESCDRQSVVIAKAQVYFIDEIVTPALQLYFRIRNSCRNTCMENLESCKLKWLGEVEKLRAQKKMRNITYVGNMRSNGGGSSSNANAVGCGIRLKEKGGDVSSDPCNVGNDNTESEGGEDMLASHALTRRKGKDETVKKRKPRKSSSTSKVTNTQSKPKDKRSKKR